MRQRCDSPRRLQHRFGRKSSLAGLAAHVHLQQNWEGAPAPRRALIQQLRQPHAIHTLDSREEPDGPLGLVRLQMPDELPSCAGQTQLRDLFLRLLHAVLPKRRQPRFIGSAHNSGPQRLRDRDQRHLTRRARCAPARSGCARPAPHAPRLRGLPARSILRCPCDPSRDRLSLAHFAGLSLSASLSRGARYLLYVRCWFVLISLRIGRWPPRSVRLATARAGVRRTGRFGSRCSAPTSRYALARRPPRAAADSSTPECPDTAPFPGRPPPAHAPRIAPTPRPVDSRRNARAPVRSPHSSRPQCSARYPRADRWGAYPSAAALSGLLEERRLPPRRASPHAPARRRDALDRRAE